MLDSKLTELEAFLREHVDDDDANTVKETIAEIARLRVALGHCKASADGRHLWAMFPAGMDGQIARAGMTGGAAGCFCQHCLIPKSPFHNEQAVERKP